MATADTEHARERIGANRRHRLGGRDDHGSRRPDGHHSREKNSGNTSIAGEPACQTSRENHGEPANRVKLRAKQWANDNVEIALLDVVQMVNRVSIVKNGITYIGLDAFNPMFGGIIGVDGKVRSDVLNEPGEQEDIDRLLNGIAYHKGYAGIADMPAVEQPDASHYFALLEATYNRGTAGKMKATYSAGMLTIWTGDDPIPTYSGAIQDPGTASTLRLQSHWGSGVRFKNIKISP